ncbi:hypothetical protein MSG28_007358 [Choristoneura fumiferana]|uniref:Uncharacterized protein n=1 Tax=Choristoneura fumiferana TaxID=7141 RepID=A0ACC0JWS4_CHOFU|nr:hypothetical protein MSG28_007358 [Choristoneura fumiferana]
MGLPIPGMSHDSPMSHPLPQGQGKPQPLPLNMAPSPMMGSPAMPGDGTKPYAATGPPPDAPYAQYPGYSYGAYPSPAYYGGYGGAPLPAVRRADEPGAGAALPPAAPPTITSP